MDASPKAVFVLGNNVDTDSVTATWLYCHGNGINWSDPAQARFEFVRAGARIKPSLLKRQHGDDWVIVHIDTGEVYNPGTHYFDHHGSEFASTGPSSASRLVYDKYPSDEPVVVDIMLFAHWVDNANRKESEKALERWKWDKGIIRNLPNMLQGLQAEMNDIPKETVLTAGLATVHSFFSACVRLRKFLDDYNSGRGFARYGNGRVLYGRIPEESKFLRSMVTRRIVTGVKVIVAHYDVRDDPKVGISSLRPYLDDGTWFDLEQLLEPLAELDPNARLELHINGKFLYIYESEILTLNVVWEEVVEPRLPR